VRRHAPTRKFFDLYLIPDVLKSPVAIFEDLKRRGYEHGLCYVGKPEQRFWDERTKVPSPRNKVFMIVMDKDRKIFDWGWEEEDPAKAGFPLECGKRFGRQLWPA